VAKDRRIKGAFVQVAIQKPQPEEIVGQLFAEQPLAAHGIKSHQDPALEQLLRGNGGAAFLGIELVKQAGKLGQHGVQPLFNAAQGMVGGDALVEADDAQKFRLGFGGAAHTVYLIASSRIHSNFSSFSAAC
jgi:hypothetical protein